jgi:hypothetical protein
MAYCVDCGTALKPEGNFCDNCGRPVSGQHPSTQAPAAAIPQLSSTNLVSGPNESARKNAGRVAAIIVLVGFLMPWISCQGLSGRETLSGIELANRGASGLWIIPVAMLIALGVLLNKGKSVQERATAAKAVIGTGVASLVVMLYYYAQLNGAGQRDELGLGAVVRQAFSIEIGAILALLGSIGVAISGFLHLQSVSRSKALLTQTEEPSSRSPSASAERSSIIRNQGE